FKEDRFARLLEWRPGTRSVVHHGAANAGPLTTGGKLDDGGDLVYNDGTTENDAQNYRLQRPERSVENALTGVRQSFGGVSVRLTDYVTGRTAMPIADPNVGQRLPAGMYVHWGMHY